MLRIRYQILAIVAIILGVFYPVIFAEVNQVDDAGMFQDLARQQNWSLQELFLPEIGSGLYYRPLIALSFTVDRFFWQLDPAMMHLENVLIHLLNALLVFFLSRVLLAEGERKGSKLPLLCALFFGLHPITVESVSWISGRTDLLAGSFVLAGTIFLIYFRQKTRSLFLLGAFLCLSLAFLTKESALGFLIGGLWMMFADLGGTAGSTGRSKHGGKWRTLAILLVVTCAGALFFLLRAKAFATNQSNVGLTIQYVINNPIYSLQVAARAFGFYLKKLAWPFPLNFTILEVDPLYELLAVPLLLISLWIVWQRSFLAALYVTGLGLLAPAFLIAYGQIAWTPFAERYLYMPAAFIVLAASHAMARLCRKQLPRWRSEAHRLVGDSGGDPTPLSFWKVPCSSAFLAKLMVVFMLPLAMVGSFLRVLDWQTNLALYRDTAQKNPGIAEVRAQYGIALFHTGELAAAERELAMASTSYRLHYEEKFDLNYAIVLKQAGKYDESRQVCARVLEKTRQSSKRAMELMLEILDEQLSRTVDRTERMILRKEFLAYADTFCGMDPEPFTLYKLGKMTLNQGDQCLARKCFQHSYARMPLTSEYRQHLEKFIQKLAKTGGAGHWGETLRMVSKDASTS
jgi:tetratricopeptide (TPR) repeat protein